jgi:hypothetical protein
MDVAFEVAHAADDYINGLESRRKLRADLQRIIKSARS